MTGIGIASLTFVCASGGAILGNYIRSAIPISSGPMRYALSQLGQ